MEEMARAVTNAAAAAQSPGDYLTPENTGRTRDADAPDESAASVPALPPRRSLVSVTSDSSEQQVVPTSPPPSAAAVAAEEDSSVCLWVCGCSRGGWYVSSG